MTDCKSGILLQMITLRKHANVGRKKPWGRIKIVKGFFLFCKVSNEMTDAYYLDEKVKFLSSSIHITGGTHLETYEYDGERMTIIVIVKYDSQRISLTTEHELIDS